MEEEVKTPVSLAGKPGVKFELTGEQFHKLKFAQEVFHQFSNMFRDFHIKPLDELTEKYLATGDLKYVFKEDLVEKILEDGKKVNELRPDFFPPPTASE